MTRNVMRGAVHTGRPRPQLVFELDDYDPAEGRGAAVVAWVALVGALGYFAYHVAVWVL